MLLKRNCYNFIIGKKQCNSVNGNIIVVIIYFCLSVVNCSVFKPRKNVNSVYIYENEQSRRDLVSNIQLKCKLYEFKKSMMTSTTDPRKVANLNSDLHMQ